MRAHWMAATVVFWTAAALAACSSSSGGGGDGSATVNGTIQGMAIPAMAAVGLNSIAMAGSMTESAVGAAITNISGACGVLQNHGNPPDASTLKVEVVANSASVAPGTYMIVSQGFGATANYVLEDQNCIDQLKETATSGTVTISSVGSSVNGSFDLMFGSDHLTGTFSAPICVYTPSDAGCTSM
jgi:phosphopentomutase